MTYLELINAVLRKLREDTVSTVSESDYSTLIGDFVNDAKRVVEDAWDWRSLKKDISVSQLSGVSTATLTDLNNRGKFLYVQNQSTLQEVNYMPLKQMDFLYLQQPDLQGAIQNYTISSISSGSPVVKFFPTPNATTNLVFSVIDRTDDLATDADELLVPASPVINWAYSFALRERGETGGQSAAEQALFAQQDLSNAIALDAGLNAEDTLWVSV